MIGGSRRTAVVLASVLLASPALAEPKAPSEKDKQIAGELVKKAIARSQAGDHSAAIDIYLQAYTIVPNVILLSNIAAQFQQSGKLPEALHYFCLYLEKDPTGTNAVYATSQAKALQILLGNKHVDDDDVCAPAKPEPRQPRQPRPRPPPPPPPETPIEEPHGDTTLKYTGLAVGVTGLVALGISAYAGYEGKVISDKINSQPKGQPWPDNIRQLQKSGENYNTLAVATVIGGGVLVATGAILLVVSRSSASSEPSRDKADKSIVHVTPTPNGFAVFGVF
jgi:tetratricopeptide (TPR) repeat protein